MNREEMILAAAREYAGKKYRNDEDRGFAMKDFQAGAQWADDNQQWYNADDLPPRNERENGALSDFSIDVLAINTNGNFVVVYYDFTVCNWIALHSDRKIKITHWLLNKNYSLATYLNS